MSSLIDLGSTLYRSFRSVRWRENDMEDATPHEPSYADACSVLEILKFFKLPTELALEVLEHAAYWPSWQSSMRQSCHASTNAGLRRNQGGAHDAVICFDSPMPDSQLLPYIEQKSIKIKEVQFDFVSRDQGWTSENTTGTYQTSSWLEVSIMRPPNPSAQDISDQATRTDFRHSEALNEWLLLRGWQLVERPASAEHYPQGNEDRFAWYLQGNCVAARSSSACTYKVVWSVLEDRCEGNEGAGSGENFLAEVEVGDRIIVWARAKWPGWACFVDRLAMTARYSF